MFWLRLLCMATACASVLAQPMGCSEDSHCSSGFYCEPERLFCHECLRCEEFQRAAPPARRALPCVTSVSECGSCFSGPDDQSSSATGCRSLDARVEHRLLPPYVWAAVAALLLTALLLCAAAAYALRNFTTYKLLSATETVQRSLDAGPELPAASAPPSYHAAVAVAAQAPDMPLEESSAPFIRTVGHLPQPTEELETLGIQKALVFSPPTYDSVGSVPSPTYELVAQRDEMNEMSPPVRGDEDSTYNIVHTSAYISRTMVPEDMGAIPAPAICRVRQDSNDSSEGSKAAEENCSSRRASSPFIINVIKNVTTVRQHNEITV